MTDEQKLTLLTRLYEALGQKPPEGYQYVAEMGYWFTCDQHGRVRFWPAECVDWNSVMPIINLLTKGKEARYTADIDFDENGMVVSIFPLFAPFKRVRIHSEDGKPEVALLVIARALGVEV